jgi:hypothetical protein
MAACVGHLFKSVLARRLCVSRLRHRPSLGVADQAVDLGIRRLPSADFSDRRHHHAPIQATADRLVLGGLSDGDPFQWHLGPATATPARPRLVQVGLATLREAAPQHGGTKPQSAHRTGAAEVEDGGPGRIRLRRGARLLGPKPAPFHCR